MGILTSRKSHNNVEHLQLFVSQEASGFDAAVDLAYKGYRIEHRDLFITTDTPIKTYGFPPAACKVIYSVAKLPRVLR